MPFDDYGFPAVMKAAFEGFAMGGRASGRTSRLVAVLQDGDVVVALRGPSLEYLRERIGKAGKKVKILAAEATAYGLGEVSRALVSGHRTLHFDHVWIEQYWSHCLRRAEGELLHFHEAMQPRLTGFNPRVKMFDDIGPSPSVFQPRDTS